MSNALDLSNSRGRSTSYIHLRNRRRIGFAGLVAVLVAGIIVSMASAATTETWRDRFSSASYSGSDGSKPWSGPWIELGAANGVLEKNVLVEADTSCAASRCLVIGWPNSVSEWGVERTADLSGALGATLEYDYQVSGQQHETTAVVRSWVGNGSTWTLLATYSLNADIPSTHSSFDITSSISGTTTVRFTLTAGSKSPKMYIDNVTITATYGAPPTTTTTVPPTTTTTVSSATTTTAPGTTTTTTTQPGTTTTQPGTTTTQPGTTTTVPGATTTAPTTTTTIVGNDSDGSASPPAAPPSTTTTIPLEPEEAAIVALNAPVFNLGSTFVTADAATPTGPADNDTSRRTVTIPGVGGLVAGYSTAVEGAASSLIPFVVLAVLVAWLSIRGLDTASRNRRR